MIRDDEQNSESLGCGPELLNRLSWCERTSVVSQFRRHCSIRPPKLLTLDIFDTLLWRPLRHPSDVFPAVAERLLAKGILCNSVSPHLFSSIRVEAEAKSRMQKFGVSEVSLHEIYANVPDSLLFDPKAAIEVELQTESDCLCIDLQILYLLTVANLEAVPYALISDMYIPRNMLSDVLNRVLQKEETRLGFTIPRPQQVYVSCDHGTGKYDRLFSVMLRQEGVEARDVIHIGDNYSSDIAAGERLGLRTVFFPLLSDWQRDILDNEVRLGCLLGSMDSHNRAGAAALHRVRLKTANSFSQEDPFAAWGAMLFGPILYAFADYVLEQAISEGVDTVFCLMREGRLLARLINDVAQRRGVAVKAEELMASRLLLKKATVSSITPAAIEELFVGVGRVSGMDLASMLELSIEDLDAAAVRPQARYDRRGLSRAIRQLLRVPGVSARLERSLAEQRERFLVYLRKVGFIGKGQDGGARLIVDLGWGGTIQQHLVALCKSNSGESPNIRGLYLATHEGTRQLWQVGSAGTGFLIDNGVPARECKVIIRTPEVIEQALMARVGSVVALDPDLNSVEAPQLLSDLQLAEIERVQAGILHFALLADELGIELRTRELLPYLRTAMVRSIAAPTVWELDLLEHWEHDSNGGNTVVRRIVPSRAEANRLAVKRSWRGLVKIGMEDFYWPAALMRRLGQGYADAYLMAVLSAGSAEAQAHLLFLPSSTQAANSHPEVPHTEPPGAAETIEQTVLDLAASACAIQPNGPLCILGRSANSLAWALERIISEREVIVEQCHCLTTCDSILFASVAILVDVAEESLLEQLLAWKRNPGPGLVLISALRHNGGQKVQFEDLFRSLVEEEDVFRLQCSFVSGTAVLSKGESAQETMTTLLNVCLTKSMERYLALHAEFDDVIEERNALHSELNWRGKDFDDVSHKVILLQMMKRAARSGIVVRTLNWAKAIPIAGDGVSRLEAFARLTISRYLA